MRPFLSESQGNLAHFRMLNARREKGMRNFCRHAYVVADVHSIEVQ
jgi:hypothetical protein